MKLNRFVFWIISCILSVSSSYLIVQAFLQMLMDPEYVKSLNAAPEHDIARQIMVGAIGLFSMSILFHLATHIIFLISCYTELKESKIDLKAVVVKKNELYSNIVRVVGYLIIILLLYSYIANYLKFYVYNFMFHLTSIFVVVAYIIWIVTVVKYLRRR